MIMLSKRYTYHILKDIYDNSEYKWKRLYGKQEEFIKYFINMVLLDMEAYNYSNTINFSKYDMLYIMNIPTKGIAESNNILEKLLFQLFEELSSYGINQDFELTKISSRLIFERRKGDLFNNQNTN